MICRTLCGCLAFPEEQVEWARTTRKVRRHYRDNPGCQEQARQTLIWWAREPIRDKLKEESDGGD